MSTGFDLRARTAIIAVGQGVVKLGQITLALVLVLPDNIEGRPDALKEFLLPLVFGVVLLTLILQATTMRPLIKLLRVDAQVTNDDA